MTDDRNIVLINSGSSWMIGSAVWIIAGTLITSWIYAGTGKQSFQQECCPEKIQITDFLFWYYRGGSCSLKMLLLMSVVNKQNLLFVAFLLLFQAVRYPQPVRSQYLYLQSGVRYRRVLLCCNRQTVHGKLCVGGFKF